VFTKLNKANVDTATNYTMCQTPGASLFDSRQDKRFFSSPNRPDQLCGPPILLFSGYRDIFFRRKDSRCVKVKLHFHLQWVHKLS